jgi:hypothetical protein
MMLIHRKARVFVLPKFYQARLIISAWKAWPSGAPYKGRPRALPSKLMLRSREY